MSEKTERNRKTATRPKLSFSGHETFVFRHSWLKKAVDAVTADGEVFTREDAIVTLGVGRNMVRSIRHWGLATGILTEEPKSRGTRLAVTEFGNLIMGASGFDPYMEDPSTLWALHWNILRQEQRCTTWHYVFNSFPSSEFTRGALTQFVVDEAGRSDADGLAESSIRRDVEVFLRTYVGSSDTRRAGLGEDAFDCPLSELGLIEARQGSDLYQLQRSQKSTLADHVFLYALCDFWNGISQAQQTLAFSEIAYRKGSPGIVFRLDENSIGDRLERLDELTKGKLTYTETAGLRQVYKHADIDLRELLEQYYATAGEFRELEVLA
ncbi:MAG: DUF4007 family protein [Bryobacterales bacterium]|nr:DUF4007 family protein [Bryobacterales bacterium]